MDIFAMDEMFISQMGVSNLFANIQSEAMTFFANIQRGGWFKQFVN